MTTMRPSSLLRRERMIDYAGLTEDQLEKVRCDCETCRAARVAYERGTVLEEQVEEQYAEVA